MITIIFRFFVFTMKYFLWRNLYTRIIIFYTLYGMRKKSTLLEKKLLPIVLILLVSSYWDNNII